MHTELEEKTSIPIYLYPIFLVVATLFLLVFSASTSALYPAYGSDSSMFLTMGQLFLQGKVPYVDFFDHKGPFLILLEAIGQLVIHDKLGVLVLQIFNLFLAQIVVFLISRIFLNTVNSCSSVLLFLVLFSLTIDGGNMTEEYCIIPLLVTLYITLQYIIKSVELTRSSVVILGLCFAFIFFIRPNNAGLCSACVTYLFILTLMRKDYKSLKILVLCFSLAILVVVGLLFGYFYYHNGVEDFLYANFLFNTKYIGTEKVVFTPLYKKMNIIAIAALFLGSLCYVVRKKDYRFILFFILILVLNILVTNIGNGYIHYLTLLLPAILLGYLLFMSSIKVLADKKIVSCIISVFLILAMIFRVSQTYSPSGWSEVANWEKKYKEDGVNIMRDIPKDEYGRTYYYSVDPRFYQIMDLTPNYKYFVIQDFHSSFDPKIEAEINGLLTGEEQPLWILTQNRELTDFSSQKIRDILTEKYSIESTNKTFVLYRTLLINNVDSVASH